MNRKQLKKKLRFDHTTGIFYIRKTGNVTGMVNADLYIQIWIDKRKYLAQDLAWLYMYGCWPKRPVIHEDGVRQHNWIDNLQSSSNEKKRKDSFTGVTGVSRDRRDHRWRAQITVARKQKNLGNYEKFEMAVLARFKAEQEFNRNQGSTASQYIKKMFL